MIERLFDIVSKRASEEPAAVMFAGKEQGAWRTWSCKEVWDTARKLAGGIESLGISNAALAPEQQEKIAIISPNRPEWIITDVGVQLTGAVLTPLYPTISVNDLAFILQESEIRIVFIANKELYERYKEVLNNAPLLKHVYSFDEVAGVENWKELLSKNKDADEGVMKRINPETLATIIYTSGTTGTPKGVMLSHKNVVSNVLDCMCEFWFAHKGDRALSFLPLNHIFERMVSYVYLNAGVAIWYAESMETIGENLKEVKPIVFCTVPRLLEKVYDKILAKGNEQKGIKRFLFFWALDLGKKYDNVKKGSLWYRIQLAIANALVFKKWREALGGRVLAIVTGAAACQDRLIRIFTSAKIVIMEGYGLSETSPVISVNKFRSEDRRIGTIGPVIDNVVVTLAEDGEILCRGNNVMMGYYKRPDITAEVMKDGWFHTGDIGTWVDNRFLKITDRKKEIFKTAGGKYVAPQPIENKMKESPYIEQILVTGADRKFVSALIVPSFANLRVWLQQQKMAAPADNKELINLPSVNNLIRAELDKYNTQFGHVEQVKKFALLPAEWTVDSGELTPTIKVKRKVVEQNNASQIEQLYV
jgi:long-chain acyl-CoA synthetase